MRSILILLFTINFGFTAHTQEPLFTPIEFTLNRQYDSIDQLRALPNQHVHSSISDIFLYHRNDSTLMAYWRNGYMEEYMLPDHWEFNPGTTRSIEFVDNGGDNDLLIIKTQYEESNTYSAWTLWFRSTTRMTIIDLEYHSIVFDFEIAGRFYNETYSYDGDITRDSISDTEMQRLIETRETEVDACDFEYVVSINEQLIQISCKAPCASDEEPCESNIREGIFELRNGVYQPKDP